MKLKMSLIATTLLMLTCSIGCQNFLARRAGGSITKNLPAGRKLVNVTWKDDDLWILTRPMLDGDKPETYLFSESSALGIAEGTVTIVEKASALGTPFVNATVKAN